jgi:hypothetical protein
VTLKARRMHAFSYGVERLQGQLRAVTRMRMGVNDRFWDPGPWVLFIRGFGVLMVSGEDFSFLDQSGCRSLPSMWKGGRFHSEKRLCSGTRYCGGFSHFVVLVLHYYDAMLPSASFCANLPSTVKPKYSIP